MRKKPRSNKKIARRKVRELEPHAKRLVEGILGRKLRENEEITLLVSELPEGNGNGESCYEVARRARLIGAIKKAPPDLSTNEKYFEGFGSK